MTVLVMAGILIFGLAAYRLLPVSTLPNVDFPTIQVTAQLPGASPETMASAIATVLEKQFSTIAGIDQMTSLSGQGTTQITIQFSLDRDIDAAAQDVNSAIASAARQLPATMPAPPSFRKVNPADFPVFYLALTSDTMPLSTVNEYAETNLAQRISTITGVAQVLIFGQQKYAVRVQVDPNALAARGVGINEVEQAIASANVNLPTGTLYGKDRMFAVQASGQLYDAAAFRSVIVTYRNGSPIPLGELGQVIDSVQNDKVAAWFKEKRGIVLAIQRQPGVNTIEVVDTIKKLRPTCRAEVPAGINIDVLFDRSVSIRASVAEVEFTLYLALMLVVLVIFIFLRNIPATIIPSIALPMSIIGTFSVMYLFDYSLDNLSLMALTLSVGFVVDDAIVMLENIVRHMEMGEPPMEAALNGSKEIGFTIISMTISLAAVFIPILFMGGILGRLFHEFAVTIGAAILVSGFVSLTLTPLLSARFLRAHTTGADAEHHGKLYQATERMFDGMLAFYESGLRWALRRRFFTLMTSVVILAATIWLFIAVPKGFIPNEDANEVRISLESAQGLSFPELVRHQRAAMDIVDQDKRVATYFSFVGRGGASNATIISLRLVPKSQRTATIDDIMNDLRPKLSAIPGFRVSLQNPPPIRLGGRQSNSQYQYTLQSADTATLYAASQKLIEKMRTLPGFVDVNSDLFLRNPTVNVEINRDRAATLGLTTSQIEDAL